MNNKILANISLDESRSIPLEQAQAEGAMMLFGEKYGDSVRMIGLAHQRNFAEEFTFLLQDQLAFSIVSESSVASGIRRIEAVTGLQLTRLALKTGTTSNQLVQTSRS